MCCLWRFEGWAEVPKFGFLFFQAEQQKQAAIISAEGDSQAALLIANSLMEAGDGLVELRKLEAAEDIAFQLSRSRNVTYLPSGQGTLLQLPQWGCFSSVCSIPAAASVCEGRWRGGWRSRQWTPRLHTHSSHSFSNQLWTGLCWWQHDVRQTEQSGVDIQVTSLRMMTWRAKYMEFRKWMMQWLIKIQNNSYLGSRTIFGIRGS